MMGRKMRRGQESRKKVRIGNEKKQLVCAGSGV